MHIAHALTRISYKMHLSSFLLLRVYCEGSINAVNFENVYMVIKCVYSL